MKKENIKQIIQELFRQNINLYPEDYPIDYVGNITQDAINATENTAVGYYNEGNEEELIRDTILGITEQNYIDWCLEELAIWANEQTENK